MTDLERVRRALGGIYKGEQERPGIRAAYEELDAHLKEDADLQTELAELRGKLEARGRDE